MLYFYPYIELLVDHPMKSHNPPETEDQGTKKIVLKHGFKLEVLIKVSRRGLLCVCAGLH